MSDRPSGRSLGITTKKRFLSASALAAAIGVASVLGSVAPAAAFGEHQFVNRGCTSWVESWKVGASGGHANTILTAGSCIPEVRIRTASGGTTSWVNGPAGGAAGLSCTCPPSDPAMGGAHRHAVGAGWNNT